MPLHSVIQPPFAEYHFQAVLECPPPHDFPPDTEDPHSGLFTAMYPIDMMLRGVNPNVLRAIGLQPLFRVTVDTGSIMLATHMDAPAVDGPGNWDIGLICIDYPAPMNLRTFVHATAVVEGIPSDDLPNPDAGVPPNALAVEAPTEGDNPLPDLVEQYDDQAHPFTDEILENEERLITKTDIPPAAPPPLLYEFPMTTDSPGVLVQRKAGERVPLTYRYLRRYSTDELHDILTQLNHDYGCTSAVLRVTITIDQPVQRHPFPHLPIELFHIIAKYLPLKSIVALSQTCTSVRLGVLGQRAEKPLMRPFPADYIPHPHIVASRYRVMYSVYDTINLRVAANLEPAMAYSGRMSWLWISQLRQFSKQTGVTIIGEQVRNIVDAGHTDNVGPPSSMVMTVAHRMVDRVSPWFRKRGYRSPTYSTTVHKIGQVYKFRRPATRTYPAFTIYLVERLPGCDVIPLLYRLQPTTATMMWIDWAFLGVLAPSSNFNHRFHENPFYEPNFVVRADASKSRLYAMNYDSSPDIQTALIEAPWVSRW
ncbi:hypothetical protein DL93DRAFT_2165346 [Clavulina sp. PMI_390]|nr:hypothetical protein DL93DRAFT_2165346 [Clavulina sp. PMI_390]